MSKQIKGEMTFEADAATAFAAITDAAYVQEKNERTGGRNVKVEVTDPSADTRKIVAARDLPAQIPSFAKKFVGEQISTVETDVWSTAPDADGAYNGTIAVDFGKAPMEMHGTLRIEPAGSGSVLKVDAAVKASVPLVGGKLEGVVADQFNRAVGAEEKIANEWLAR